MTKIKIIDDLNPEDSAMAQALYSRSPASVDDHLAKIEEVGSGKFMDQYYVGYGHASIGDCGTTTAFIEGVPMLAAKAIQDWPLYSGQEASTRYMDFSSVVFSNPIGTLEGHKIQERWRSFYVEASPLVREHVLQTYPMQPEDDEKTYHRAVSARVFDIMRAFLPAGAHTNLSWTTNLRQANDHLRWTEYHPDPSVTLLADELLVGMRDKYPRSFGDRSLKTNREGGNAEAVRTYMERCMSFSYFLFPWEESPYRRTSVRVRYQELRAPNNAEVDLLTHRPRGAELPRWFAELGVVVSSFLLDFGSFRDLQRHRNGTIRMPILSTSQGFHPWYLEHLPEDVRAHAECLLEEQEERIFALTTDGETPIDKVTAQHYIPMGYRVVCRVTQSLPAFLYRVELRSAKTVHPTLRAVVLEEIERFLDAMADYGFGGIAVHADRSPDSWTVRRGAQTIEVQKQP